MREAMWVTSGKRLGIGPPKPSGAHGLTPCALLDPGCGAVGLNACPGFSHALTLHSSVPPLSFENKNGYLIIVYIRII